MITYSSFSNNCRNLMQRIEAACVACGREADSVKLLPVTKVHPVDAVAFAVQYGFVAVGENKVQEVVQKRADRPNLQVQWELIGHLQSNKAQVAAAHFDRIQTVDSLKLAQKLDRAAAELGKCLKILVQVNAGDDPAKYGVSYGEAPGLLESLLDCNSIEIEGLMTIAPLSEDPSVAQRTFERLRILRDQLAERVGKALPELSMGMSGDLEQAIAAGSTQIRVGTALFGSR